MTGIELLQMIKNYEIKEGTEINVLRTNEECCCFDVVAKLKYSDNDLLWSPGTFRSSMLWDNDYLFEIVESKEVPNKIEKLSYQQLGTYQLDNNDSLEFIKALNDQLTKYGRKVNELIKTVNYLLDTQNKG